MTLAERIADAARELPPEKQAEVLDFVEFLRARQERPAAPRRGSLEALRGAMQSTESTAGSEQDPDWSPLEIEPAELRDVEIDP